MGTTVAPAGLTKRRKRNKKKKKVEEKQEVQPAVSEENGKKKRKNKKKKNPGQNNSGAIQIKKISGFFEKNKDVSGSKTNKSDDLLQFSNERLKAYGVNPNQFKRKLKKEKFKNMLDSK